MVDKKTTKSAKSAIEREIMEVSLPIDIITKGCEIYSMLDFDGVPRGNNRSKVKCYCLYQAYIELDKQIIPDPCYIGKLLGLSAFDSDLSVSKRPSFKDGYVPKRVIMTPKKILASYLANNISLPESVIEGMIDTFNKVIESKPSLLQEKPKPLVAAYILTYSSYTSLCIDKNDLASVFYLEYPTIRSKIELVKDVIITYL